MDCEATVRRVEPAVAPAGACMLPVEHLQVADEVLDRTGRPHRVAQVMTAGAHQVWIQRDDLAYRERLTGTVMAIPHQH